MSRSPDPDLAALEADPRIVWTEDVLRFGDTDANGHINNAAFAVFCESGRVNILHGRLGPIRRDGSFYAVVRLLIEFRAELLFPGRVRCGTWMAAMGRTSMTFAQALFSDAGRLAATSEAVIVAVDATTRRPLPIGPEARALTASMLRPGP